MGILSGLFRSRDKPKNSTSGSGYRFFYGQSSAGKCVTERSAMQMTAVYACVRILSEAVAGLPRGDYASRMSGYATARQNGWMSANDIRELENLDRISDEEGGNLYLVNGSMTKLSDAGAFAEKNNEKEENTNGEKVLELGKSYRRK